jgi:hypothetical protein
VSFRDEPAAPSTITPGGNLRFSPRDMLVRDHVVVSFVVSG